MRTTDRTKTTHSGGGGTAPLARPQPQPRPSRSPTTPHFAIVALLALAPLTAPAQARFLTDYQAKKPPHFIRLASVATATLGTIFQNPEDLGKHGYIHNWSEKTGIIFTCKAGHIDLGHLRKAADWTAYLAAKTLRQIKQKKTYFVFKLYEPTLYHVYISYPPDWSSLPPDYKDRIAHEVAVLIGQYCTYIATTWHEVLTWYGYRSTLVISEFQSAFSWEDPFSNLLGIHLAAKALRDPDHSFCDAMTTLLAQELRQLDAQPAHIAQKAAQAVEDYWYTYDLIFLDMKKRNFDIGIDDGYLTPWIIPIGPCSYAHPKPYPVPTLKSLHQFGFTARLEIQPREIQAGRILSIVYPNPKNRKNRLEPTRHLPIIMADIKKRAVKKYGPDVDNPYSDPTWFDRFLNHTTPPGPYNPDNLLCFEDLLALAQTWLNAAPAPQPTQAHPTDQSPDSSTNRQPQPQGAIEWSQQAHPIDSAIGSPH